MNRVCSYDHLFDSRLAYLNDSMAAVDSEPSNATGTPQKCCGATQSCASA